AAPGLRTRSAPKAAAPALRAAPASVHPGAEGGRARAASLRRGGRLRRLPCGARPAGPLLNSHRSPSARFAQTVAARMMTMRASSRLRAAGRAALLGAPQALRIAGAAAFVGDGGSTRTSLDAPLGAPPGQVPHASMRLLSPFPPLRISPGTCARDGERLASAVMDSILSAIVVTGRRLGP